MNIKFTRSLLWPIIRYGYSMYDPLEIRRVIFSGTVRLCISAKNKYNDLIIYSIDLFNKSKFDDASEDDIMSSVMESLNGSALVWYFKSRCDIEIELEA